MDYTSGISGEIGKILDQVHAELLTVSETAGLLRVSSPTIYRLIREEGFPVVRIGEQIRIPKKLLMDYIRVSTAEKDGMFNWDVALKRTFFSDVRGQYIEARGIKIFDTTKAWDEDFYSAWSEMAAANQKLESVKIITSAEKEGNGRERKSRAFEKLMYAMKSAFHAHTPERTDSFYLGMAAADAFMPAGAMLLEDSDGQHRHLRIYPVSHADKTYGFSAHQKPYSIAFRERQNYPGIIAPLDSEFDRLYGKSKNEGRVMEWRWP
ncbi:MAG: helix-turn-helix domain-containing protein [Candidatus Aenigmarchaeota archaeon]|nr:helix-turn-helix domain-containing protein [Candidatus Aenigmarchaeota archaeon]